jgi:DNA polymerase (family 10)
VVVASVHTGLRQDKDTITARVVQAMHNPHVDIIGHPSGRLLGEREASEVDLDRVLDVAADTGTLIEVNASLDRLDLDDAHIRRAIGLGVALCINSDAHSTDGLKLMEFGVATARRGWAEAKHIVNTWPLEALVELLTNKRVSSTS